MLQFPVGVRQLEAHDNLQVCVVVSAWHCFMFCCLCRGPICKMFYQVTGVALAAQISYLKLFFHLDTN